MAKFIIAMIQTSVTWTDPTKVFNYASEQRLQCTSCKKVRYRVDKADILSIAIPVKEKGKNDEGKTVYEDVQLSECISGKPGKEALEYSCPDCKTTVIAVKWVLPLGIIITLQTRLSDKQDLQLCPQSLYYMQRNSNW